MLLLVVAPRSQVLLCIYCFLAGMAVSTGRLLWLLPLATAASAAVHWLAGSVSQAVLPFYRELTPERAALWRVDITHLVYSAVTGGLLLDAGRGCCLRHTIDSHAGNGPDRGPQKSVCRHAVCFALPSSLI
jgi:hypothetical protein